MVENFHVQFPGLGLQFDISNVAFQVGDRNIYWYGLIIAAGMLLAMLYAWRTAPRYNVQTSKLFNCVIVGVITGIIGARLYYCAFTRPIRFPFSISTRAVLPSTAASSARWQAVC